MLITLTDQSGRHLTQLNERYAPNGTAVHKFRISHSGSRPSSKSSRRSSSTSSSPPRSPFLKQPSLSPNHELARALIAATRTGNPGVRMSVFGPFIREVPSRLGHNPALDAAAAVLVDVHRSLVHKQIALAKPQLYLRAIKMLQSCLEDPRQGMSANTLCASVLLSLVEVRPHEDECKYKTDIFVGFGGPENGQSLLGSRRWRRPLNGTTRTKQIPRPLCQRIVALQ